MSGRGVDRIIEHVSAEASTSGLLINGQLITDAYRKLNTELHAKRADYGVSGAKWAPTVRRLMEQHQTNDVLDYGCGKRTLERALGFPIANYDPAIPALAVPPEPHDIVVCGDVLEHVEMGCLDAVLADIARVTRKCCMMVVATRPAGKNLPDGRNAHLIVRPVEWWLPTILEAPWQIDFLQRLPNQEFICLTSPPKPTTPALQTAPMNLA